MSARIAWTGAAAAGMFIGGGCASDGGGVRSVSDAAWRDHFDVSKSRLRDQGAGAYFVLVPGAIWAYQGDDEVLTITVLPKVEVVDGVRTRVIEEREEEGGILKEVSRNYLAIEPVSGDVYYFGEEVDIYDRSGKVVKHEGAWRSGKDGARFGMLVSGRPRTGDRYYQEIASGVAMDRAEVVSVDERIVTPAGVFEHCLHIRETSPLESGSSDKWFAPGVGLVKDGEVVLVSYAQAGR